MNKNAAEIGVDYKNNFVTIFLLIISTYEPQYLVTE